jgi:hypothetical protein
MKKTIQLVKETKVDRVLYWVKLNGSWSYVFDNLEDAEQKYKELCAQETFEPSIEVLKSINI